MFYYMAQTPSVTVKNTHDPLEPFRNMPVHVLVFPTALRDQLKVILATLKFKQVTFHPCSNRFLKNTQELALILRSLKEGLVLVGPLLEVADITNKTRPPRDISEFFSIVSILLTRAKRDPLKCLPLCVPVFEDIEFIHKREGILLRLAEYGISGAFILKKQDPLGGMNPKRKKLLLKEQMLERYTEVRNYLTEYLPHRQDNLETLMEKREERKLSERKAEAESWIKQAEEFKDAKNYERSIQCYKKAIELYPVDPRAYLESGKVYVRVRKYPHALQRFRQAEEVAENLPEPNKEIGRVRILQVRERIANGEPANSPEIVRLMDDAVENFSKALIKAEEVQLTGKGDEKERNVNAVMKITGEIIKMDVASTLGESHPSVRKLSGMTRDSLLLIKGKSINELPAKQLIFMGQAALDAGDFQTAEQHFYRASKDMGFYHEALKEIIFLGHFVRRRKGPETAIGIYQRLLEHNPPDKGAVFFNLAVAFSDAHKGPEAAQSIIRGIYIQPDMAQDPQFYKSPSLHPALHFVMDFYGSLSDFKQDSISKADLYATLLHERLLVAILSKNMAQTAQHMLTAAQKMPSLFKRQEILGDETLMQGLEWLLEGLEKAQKNIPPKLMQFTARVLALRSKSVPSEEMQEFRSEMSQFYELVLAKQEPDLAAAMLATAAMNHPGLCSEAHFGAGPLLRSFAAEVTQKLRYVDMTRLR